MTLAKTRLTKKRNKVAPSKANQRLQKQHKVAPSKASQRLQKQLQGDRTPQSSQKQQGDRTGKKKDPKNRKDDQHGIGAFFSALSDRRDDGRLSAERSLDMEITWADIIALWSAYLIIISINPVQSMIAWTQVNWRELRSSKVAQALGISGGTDGEATALGVNIGDEEPMKDGEVIAGYTVTSPRGWRIHPVHGGRRFHDGVDFGTPEGTPLIAFDALRVECFFDEGGGGEVARFDYGGFSHQLLHLSKCYPGIIPTGGTIALTGNTGTSTGPHLDYQMLKSNRKVEPSRSVVTALFTGQPIKSAGGTSGNDFIEKYKAAISRQESGDRYDEVNHSGSGAIGKYQFMPETAVAYADKCGIELNKTVDQLYLNPVIDPDVQEQLMDCYVNEHLYTIENSAEYAGYPKDDKTKCRMLASGHYSPDPKLYDDPSPQFWNGDSYPSIRDYTLSVCKNF